jgi:hypothetical protein
MKNLNRIITLRATAALVIAVSQLFAAEAFAQNPLQFTFANKTEEGAIRLSWSSNTNEVYRIDYADELATNDDGTTTWNTLYSHYPSHGTNTFWLDAGNYDLDPQVPHPKYGSMRFYRIAVEGTNDGPNPLVQITSTTSNAVLSGRVTISVTVTSTMPVNSTKLYVDGQEMWPSANGSNYVINTCEWPNGSHILFATALSLSHLNGPRGLPPLSIGRAVSPYVPVTFSNLIARAAFSEPFFEPSLGQTQQVSAAFAANVDWTLQIINQASNVVRTATGSGISLLFDWDGTGDGGTNLPNGVYHYVISAQTNGQAFSSFFDQYAGAAATADSADAGNWYPRTATEAIAAGLKSYFVQFPPLPPYRSNGVWVAREPQPPVEVQIPEELVAQYSSFLSAEEGSSDQDAASYAGAQSQSTTAPTRTPTAPVKDAVDTFGIGYYTYAGGRFDPLPGNGLPFPATLKIHLDGDSSTANLYAGSIPDHEHCAVEADAAFKLRGWKRVFKRSDDQLFANSIRRNDLSYGGGEIFTSATIGIFLSHGSYGTDPDYSDGSSGSKQTYFSSANKYDSGDNAWIRMCQFGFGGGLKWMGIYACNALHDQNYSSMLSKGAIPLKTTHLLCGSTTVSYALAEEPGDWVSYLLDDNEPVPNAWFDAGTLAYHNVDATNFADTIIYRVTGYLECLSDKVTNNVAPSNPSSSPGNLTEIHQLIFVP